VGTRGPVLPGCQASGAALPRRCWSRWLGVASWILAYEDASWISMVMAGSLSLRLTGKGGVNQQNPRGDGAVGSHASQSARSVGHAFFVEREGNVGSSFYFLPEPPLRFPRGGI
jgi:hypothetical protein